MAGNEEAEVTPPEWTLVWDDRFREYAFGPVHPFTEASRWLAVRLMEAEGLLSTKAPRGSNWVQTVPVASSAELERFHEVEYLDLVERASQLRESFPLDQGDTPSFLGCYDAAARIAKGTIIAADSVFDGPRRAFNPGGGLHHAHPDRASGFCIFNDLGLAIATQLKPPGRRVAYVDIDAHHGDGVMYGFYEEGRVLDIDFHQDGRTLFPGTGAVHETGRGDGSGLKVNVPLPPGTGDDAFRTLFRRVVPPMLRSFRPDLILLQNGVDAHVDDRLAGLALTPASYHEVVATMRAMAHELCDDRLVVTGGGGYTAANVSRVLARVGRVLSGEQVDPSERKKLPQAWRAEFESTLGTSAPFEWGDSGVPSRSVRAPSWTHSLVGAIEESLGRSLPDEATES
ncbi:MAG: acetoin utilization protein AcuC [Thermoplasmata archaeon]